jgi:hypothetical protein
MKKSILLHRTLLIRPLLVMIMSLSLANYCRAQLKGDHVMGDAGLQSGTQAPPSMSIVVPFYFYNAGTFKNSSGDKVSPVPNINVFFTAIGGSIVTNQKILGGNYGASLLIPFASNKLDGGLVYSKSSLAFSDIYIQPISLGWHVKQADFTAGYGLYLPTGTYTLGGTNSGLGMTVNEFDGGTTVYLDPRKSISFSTLLSYSINSKKKGTDIKTGDQLEIEGGLGKTFMKKVEGSPIPMIINVGIVYYMQYKMSSDQIPIGDAYVFNGNKDHIYGLGLEGNVLLPKLHSSIGLRWEDELGAVNRYQGNTFFITLVPYLKFLAPKAPPKTAN